MNKGSKYVMQYSDIVSNCFPNSMEIRHWKMQIGTFVKTTEKNIQKGIFNWCDSQTIISKC